MSLNQDATGNGGQTGFSSDSDSGDRSIRFMGWRSRDYVQCPLHCERLSLNDDWTSEGCAAPDADGQGCGGPEGGGSEAPQEPGRR